MLTVSAECKRNKIRDFPHSSLSPQINLVDTRYSHFYDKASHTLQTNQNIQGGPKFFSYTIPDTIKNMNGAISFAKYLVYTDGRKILTQVESNPIAPSLEREKAYEPEI